jgi:hypothetical protein
VGCGWMHIRNDFRISKQQLDRFDTQPNTFINVTVSIYLFYDLLRV